MKTTIEANVDTGCSDVSLVRGGPFYQILKVLRLIHRDRWCFLRQITFIIAIGWLPLLLITLLFRREALMSFLRDYRIHSRMLISVPVLLLNQGLMEFRFRTVLEHIRNARLLADADLLRTDGFMVGVRRLRDSVLPELVILLLVFAHTYFSLPKMADVTPWLATATGTSLHLTPAGWYTALISATIFQFLVGLSLWKWLLWSIFAFRLSRLRLNLFPAHPDRRGGLGFLGLTPVAFAPISFAVTAVVGATWRHEILHHNAHLIDFKLPAIALVAVVAVLALLPLLFFVPRLGVLRRKGILEYSTLGQIQTSAFHEKWITHRAGRESQLLTEMESSNVIDYSRTYDRVKEMIPLPVDRGTFIPLALSIVIPALPTILAEIPVAVALKDLFKALR